MLSWLASGLLHVSSVTLVLQHVDVVVCVVLRVVGAVVLPAVRAAVLVNDVDVAGSWRRAVVTRIARRLGTAVAGRRQNVARVVSATEMSATLVSAAEVSASLSRWLNSSTNLECIVCLT